MRERVSTEMRIEYQLILEDFERELGIAGELAAATGPKSPFSPEARISLANGLTLLLASIFEEYVRQLVRAVWSERRKVAANLDGFPNKLRSKLWRAGLERAARRSFTDVDADPKVAREKIEHLLKFCLDGDLSADVEKEISHNDNNMRPGEITRLFNQIGIQDIIGICCSKQIVLSFFDRDNAGQTADVARASLEDFFVRRNIIAHEISFGSSGGPTAISKDIETFRVIATGLAQAADGFEAPASAPPVDGQSSRWNLFGRLLGFH